MNTQEINSYRMHQQAHTTCWPHTRPVGRVGILHSTKVTYLRRLKTLVRDDPREYLPQNDAVAEHVNLLSVGLA